jgi:hypothetical protein
VTKPPSSSTSGVAVLVLDVGRIGSGATASTGARLQSTPLLAPARPVREVTREFQHNVLQLRRLQAGRRAVRQICHSDQEN